MKKHPFLFCGLIGWCLEILWTGLHSLLRGRCVHERHHIPSYVSHLRLCISDSACLSENKNLTGSAARILIYCRFYLGEFTSGSILQAFHICPWDYSTLPINTGESSVWTIFRSGFARIVF